MVFNVDKMLDVPDDFAIGVLDAVLSQDAATPVTATADDLSMDGTLLSLGPGSVLERGQWMIDVFTNRVLRTLDGHQILILAFAAGHRQPIHVVRSFVLVALDKVPAEDKVLGDIVDAVTNDTHGGVVPGHAAVVGFTQLIGLPIFDCMEIHDAIVVEVLAREHLVLHAGWMHVSQRMLAAVPAPEAQIETTNEGHLVVDDDELFMMSPVKGHIAGILKDVMVGMSQDRDVTVAGAPLGTQCVESVLGMSTVAADGLGDLLVDYDVDLDAGFGPPLQNLVQPPFLVVKGWAA